jgi:hypothetical protein
MAGTDQVSPKTPSSDYSSMMRYWQMVEAILGGAEKLRQPVGVGVTMGVAGPPTPPSILSNLNRDVQVGAFEYLPKFENESQGDYNRRRQHAPLTNIYSDISRNLASKPFSKTLELADETPDQYKKLAENIDGQGNNLHVFAGETFKAGLDKGFDWILVDYTKVPPGSTLADEAGIGARPYWVRIQAERMLAVYSDFLNGSEIFVHARIYEPTVQRVDYIEQLVERVRVFNRDPIFGAIPNVNEGLVIGYQPPTWQVWEAQMLQSADAQGKTTSTETWVMIDNGKVTVGFIPLVPFRTGRRHGTTWKVDPPLRDLAYMQIEEFQQESNLKTIKELTAFPMLTGNGVNPPSDGGQITIGPHKVLFAPPNADGRPGVWAFIEPSAESLNFLKSDLEALRKSMKDLGMQPLTDANLTVVTTANVAAKAHNAVQAWALGLKDALQQAWKFTAMWLNQKDEPLVNVHTDFGVDQQAGTELAEINKSTWLSDQNKASEFKRRGVLADDFDWDDNELQMAEKQANQTLQPEKMMDPITGQPIVVTPQPGVPNPPPQPPAKPALN